MEQVRALALQQEQEPVQLRQGQVLLASSQALRQELAQEPVPLALAQVPRQVRELAQALPQVQAQVPQPDFPEIPVFPDFPEIPVFPDSPDFPDSPV